MYISDKGKGSMKLIRVTCPELVSGLAKIRVIKISISAPQEYLLRSVAFYNRHQKNDRQQNHRG